MKPYRFSFMLVTVGCLFLCLMACGSSKNGNGSPELIENPPFTITEKYIQPWVAGVQEAGSGVDVVLQYDLNQGTDITFLNIYFRGRVSDINKEGKSSGKIYVTLRNGSDRPDTIMSEDPQQEAQNIPAERMKFELGEYEAVISYMQKDNIYYFKISEIPEKELLAYPGTGRQDKEN